MKRKILFSVLVFVFTSVSYSQLKVETDGSVWQGYSGYSNIYMGTHTSQEPNGQYYTRAPWALEVWGANFNIWKPWPTPFNGISRNYYLFINVAGGVGIGHAPTHSGICLDVNGTVYASGLDISSDRRLKTDIKPLANKVKSLYQLKAKSYRKHSKQAEITLPDIKDKKGNIIKKFEKSNYKRLPGKEEFGFLAQELKEVYPELVSKDKLGYYSVNYIGLIPILVEAIKEQKREINELKEIVKKSNVNYSVQRVAGLNSKSLKETDPLAYPILEQNTPNPFNKETTIEFYIPKSVTSANINIYDMNGRQLKSTPIYQREKGKVIIKGSEFKAGMYLYALIVDGKLIDTKRMVLTK